MIQPSYASRTLKTSQLGTPFSGAIHEGWQQTVNTHAYLISAINLEVEHLDKISAVSSEEVKRRRFFF